MGIIGSRHQSGRSGSLPAALCRNSYIVAATLLAGLAGLLLFLETPNVDTSARPAWAAQELSPPLKLPWQDGQAWLTGVSGFHTAKDALDFLPPDSPLNLAVTCEGGPGWVPAESEFWVVAAAAGTVTQASDNVVVIDHGNGWTTGYYHLHSFQVQPGDTVPPKWTLGHPSNYGDCSTGPQVHFWALGPDGQTLRDLMISGGEAMEIGINVAISDTGNFPPASSPSPTPTPTPTPTPLAVLKGDVDCDGDVDAVDALKELRHVAGLPISQVEPCHDIGAAGASTFGDVDCDDDVDAVDSLRILRHVANLPTGQEPSCPPMG